MIQHSSKVKYASAWYILTISLFAKYNARVSLQQFEIGFNLPIVVTPYILFEKVDPHKCENIMVESVTRIKFQNGCSFIQNIV